MRVLILHLLFLVTGATGLVYEVIWTRMLGHVVGNTTQAIGLVLAAFMAGLALGSLALGRWADRRTDPLKVYALLELGIGACALAIPGTFELLLDGYAALHAGFSGHAGLIGAARFVVAFLVLVVPTFLMGATLPVLARYAVREKGAVGGRLGTLYGINTLGAMAGAWASGFVLMRAFGISGAGHVAVALNAAVAVCALLLHRVSEPVPVHQPWRPDPQDPRPDPDAPPQDPAFRPGYVWLYGLSGMVALALEVLWTKSLSFFLGNTTQAFATMLSTFLFGLSLGAFAVSRVVDRMAAPARAVGTCLVAIGAAGLLTLPLFGAIMNRTGMPGTATGFLVAALVMLPATLFMGAMLPLTARLYVGHGHAVSGRVGRMVAVNTAGAILGSVLAAFATIPLFGIHGSILAMCALSVLAGSVVLLRERGNRLATAAQCAVALGLLAFFVLTAHERFFSVLHYTFREGFRDEVESLYYNETSAGIVEVTREDAGFMSYKIDGQNQAKTSVMGLRVHNLLSQLGLLLHPHPKKVLMVALGGGMTAGGAVPFDPLYDLDTLDVVEISPAIVEVAAQFKDYNHDVLSFPKLRVTVEDGRNFMLTAGDRYDVIVTGVIHPKHNAGNAGMYGSEYYNLVKRRLAPGGVVVQWTPLNGVREAEFKRILATFVDAFPHTTLWFSQNFGGFARGNNNLMVVGSLEPLPLDFAAIAGKMAHPSVRAAMGAYGVHGPVQLLDAFVTDADGIRAYVNGAPVLRDDHNPLEFLPQEEHAPAVLATLLSVRQPVAPRLVNAPPAALEQMARRYALSDMLLRADLAADTRRFGAALGLYGHALRDFGGAEVARAAGEVRFLADDWLKRREAAFAAAPASPQACARLGEALVELERWGHAVETLERCLALSATVDVYLNLGRAHYGAQHFDQAIRVWTHATQVAPKRHEPHFNMGLAAERQGHYDAALEHYAAAAERAPEDAAVLARYGKILVRQGRMEEAMRVAMHVNAIDPAEPWAADVARQVAAMQRRAGPARP
ncbi:MAG: fused MFS/spermidine synthase [Nitrospirae bacterium]|nr:fused MFS/spermidine synthase [Nitrospirota bacterium]